MIAGCACFSANDACTKIAVAWLPPSEIVGIRAVFTLLFALAIIAARGELAHLHRVWDLKIVLRAFAEAVTGLILIAAFAFMALASVTAILMVQPFLLAAAAVLFFKETVGWRRWAAIAARGSCLRDPSRPKLSPPSLNRASRSTTRKPPNGQCPQPDSNRRSQP